MWDCSDEITSDGFYLSNEARCHGTAQFSKDLSHVPQIVFTLHVVKLAEGLRLGFAIDTQLMELFSSDSEGRVCDSQPGVCKNDSIITVQLEERRVLVYVDEITICTKHLNYKESAHLHLTLNPGSAVLFDMSLSLSHFACSVAVLRKQGITFTNANPYTFNLDAISNKLNRDSQSGSVIFDRTVSGKHHFYQLEIRECGADSAVGIGLADRSHDPSKFPGWKKKSCGYHSDDGILFKKGQHNKVMPSCTVGDIMGCGIRFTDRDTGDIPRGVGEAVKGEKIAVYFTKNSLEVGEVTMSVPEGGLFPTVGLSEGDRVVVDFAAATG